MGRLIAIIAPIAIIIVLGVGGVIAVNAPEQIADWVLVGRAVLEPTS